MQIFTQTERLILREILPTDDEAIFALDSDPEVHRYLGSKPITDIAQSREIIASVRQQYMDNGIGRWAVIEIRTGNFIGWSGLKLLTDKVNNHVNVHDIGYRFIKSAWSKGYATESALAVLDYGFNQMKLKHIYGMANVHNAASNYILKKIGLKYIETFDHSGILHHWYKMEMPVYSKQ